MARPKLDPDADIVQLQIRLTAPILKRLRIRAAKESRPMSSLARLYIMEGLKRKPAGEAAQ
jgi:hypothetical protein